MCIQRLAKIRMKDIHTYPSPLLNLEILCLSCHQITVFLCYLSRLINLTFYFIKECLHDVKNFVSVKCSNSCRVSSREFHVSVGNVSAIIPRHNKSGHIQSDFGIKIIHDAPSFPSTNTCQCQASPIVFMKPHGTKFSASDPATIFLPLIVRLKADDEIICLCSDTEMAGKLNWQQMSHDDFTVCGNFIKLRATHFSFYTAIVNKGYPEASKMIYAGIGGTLDVPEVPGVEVVFPGSAVQYDIEATIKVMFADGPYDVDHDDPTANALAAPVIKLGPTGHSFNPESKKKVQLQLPLPNGREIFENCGRPFLTFWQSTSAEGQLLDWKLFQAEHTVHVDDDGIYLVRFSVQHFTFFRVLWSILDSAINEAKIGASFFYPSFEFYIVFQAFMSENEDDRTFGLCFLCHRMGSPLEGIGNYPIFVGSSGPRMVTSGLLQIRVVSSIFEANTDFGEELLMQQELFNGRPFDKQFACKYIQPNVPDHGMIGKVFIEKKNDDGTVEPLFDFLLTKPRPSQEMPQATSSQGSEDHDESWEGQLSMELASLLSIKTDQDLGDNAWEDIALALGYQPLEIHMKFRDEVDPFLKLLDDYKKRGGNPNDFISAMYKIGRKEKVCEYEQKLRNALPVGEDLNDDLIGHDGSISPSRTSSSSGVVLPSMPVNNRKRRHTTTNKGTIPIGKLADVAQRVLKNWKKLGRVLELDENQLREIEQDYENDGIQEQCYQMLLAWKERYPDQGYETLSYALGKLHLNDVARQLNFN